MKRTTKTVLAGLALLVAGGATLAISGGLPTPPGVEVQQATAPDPGSEPLDLMIWKPTAPAASGSRPLIVISHGTGGSNTGHSDTAAALAQAGYVVVAVTHTGDNYRDTSGVGKGTHLLPRARHVSRTIDFMLRTWPEHAQIDQHRIGMFGHSAGGFTALVVAGAEPDLTRTATLCRHQPEAWTCRYVERHGLSRDKLAGQKNIAWSHDPRVRSIAIAAPAVGYAFDRERLAHVNIPVQLWGAETDDIVDDSADLIRRALPAPPEYHRVAKAGHFSFLMPCNGTMRTLITVMHWFGTEAVCDDPAGFDRERFHQDFNRSLVGFFRRSLPASKPARQVPRI